MVMDEQTANDEYTFNLLLKGMDQSGIKIPNYFETTHNQKNILDGEDPTSFITHIPQGSNGSKFILTFDYCSKKVIAKWSSYALKDKPVGFSSHVFQSIFDKFQSYNHGKVGHRIKSICGFTEHRLKHCNGDVLRACPNYRNEKDWFDWVLINWGDNCGLLEGQCLMFIDFDTIILERNTTPNQIGMHIPHNIMSYGKTVLIHSITADTPTQTRPFLPQKKILVQ